MPPSLHRPRSHNIISHSLVFIYISQATVPQVREHAGNKGRRLADRARTHTPTLSDKGREDGLTRPSAHAPNATAHVQHGLLLCASALGLPIGRGGGGGSALEHCCGECAFPREVPLYRSNERDAVKLLTPFKRFRSVLFWPLLASPRSSSAALKSVTRRLSSGLPSSVTSSSSAILDVFSRCKT